MEYLKKISAIFLLTLLASCVISPLKVGIHSPEIAPNGYFPPGTPEIALKENGAFNEGFKYPVMFGTNRKPTADRKGLTDERDKQVNYGRVLVEIPKDHKVGSIGGGLQDFFGLVTDPPLKIEDVQIFDKDDQFLAYARGALKPVTSPENGYLLVFIHGYNTSFEDAALRAAQLGADLEVPQNNMYFFSWPAIKKIRTYTRDEASIEYSEKYLKLFLDTVLSVAGNRKVHIVAHSMGNRALLRVIGSFPPIDGRRPFGQIILAAADVDEDVFNQLGASYLEAADKTTVYISPFDYAVRASIFVHKYGRVGCANRATVNFEKIDNVVSALKSDFPQHSYFAETRPILLDVKNLILRGLPARGSDAWSRIAKNYWRVGGVPNEKNVLCKQ